MKCIILDDEPIARRGMKRLAERHQDLEIGGLFGTAEEALAYLEKESVDLIFLDIQMPGLTGIELAHKLPEKTMIIFTTAYSQYALEGYEVNAIDYLVKPIEPERFDKAVERARELYRLSNIAEEHDETPIVAKEHLIVKADRRFVRIRFADILYVEGLKDYITLHTRERKIVTRMTMKGIEDLLPIDQFIRVNKSYIANLDCIDSFDGNDIIIGKQEIAIGPNYKETVMERLFR